MEKASGLEELFNVETLEEVNKDKDIIIHESNDVIEVEDQDSNDFVKTKLKNIIIKAEKALDKNGKHWVINRDFVGRNANILAK